MNKESKSFVIPATIVEFPRQQLQLPLEAPLQFSMLGPTKEPLPEFSTIISVERPLRYFRSSTLLKDFSWGIADAVGKDIYSVLITPKFFLDLLNVSNIRESFTHMEFDGGIELFVERRRNMQHQGLFQVATLPPEGMQDQEIFFSDLDGLRDITYFKPVTYQASGNSTINIPIESDILSDRMYHKYQHALIRDRPMALLVFRILTPLRTTSDYPTIDFRLGARFTRYTPSRLTG